MNINITNNVKQLKLEQGRIAYKNKNSTEILKSSRVSTAA